PFHDPDGRSDPRRQARADSGAKRMNRRWSGLWGRRVEPAAPEMEVLIPTVGRPAELGVTLAGLAAQDQPRFSVVISDQSEEGIAAEPTIASMLRVLQA